MSAQAIRVLLMAERPQNQGFIAECLTKAKSARAFQLTFAQRDPAPPTAGVGYILPVQAALEFDLLLLDFSGDIDLESVRKIHQAIADVPLVVIGDQEDDATTAALLQAGAQDYLWRSELTAYWLRRVLHATVARMKAKTASFAAPLLPNIQAGEPSHPPEQAAQRRFRDLVNSIEGIVWEANAQPFQCTFVSPQIERILGYSVETWLSKPDFWDEHIHPEDHSWVIELSLRATAEQRNYQCEYRMLAADGRIVWVKDMITVVVEAGQVTKLRGIMFDVTKRKQAEAQLKRYTHTLEAFNQIHLSLMAGDDLEKLVQLVTEVATEVSGAQSGAFFYHPQNKESKAYKPYTLAGRSHLAMAALPLPYQSELFKRIFRGEGIIRLADVTQSLGELGQTSTAKLPANHLPVRSYLAAPVVSHQGEVIGGLFFAHEQPGVFTEEAEKLVGGIAAQAATVIEKTRLYIQLKEREDRFRQLIEDAADGIFIGNLAGVCQEVNTALCRLLGYTRAELIGRSLASLLPPADVVRLASALAHLQQGQVHIGEWTLLGKDGKAILIESSAKMLSDATWQAIVRDITQRKRTEDRLRQQDRLAMVGQLAAGIAHDFNNILSVIMLYTQTLLKSPNLVEKEQQRLQTIYEQTQRAADLTAQILDFSRQSVLERQPIEVKPFFTELVSLLQRTLPENIDIQLTCDESRLVVKADPTRLQQVFMNLAVNARDAMPEGGKLQIQVALLLYEAHQRPPVPDMPLGYWIRMKVSDTGDGIRPDTIPYIFDPFYSTKARGKGTGLGLAQVYGIIKQHQGFIDVSSQLGQGTAFTIYLPALLASDVKRPPSRIETNIRGHGETILVVEDDPSAREAMSDILEMLNYQVLTATNGKEALTLFDTHTSTIALVLTDMVMPSMDGRNLLKNLKRKQSDVKMIMMTGYPFTEKDKDLLRQGITTWLPKPFEIEQVAKAIQMTLDTEGREPLELA